MFLNCRLDDVTLVPKMRKPFDVLAEGLISKTSRGDKKAIELFLAGVRGWNAASLVVQNLNFATCATFSTV